MLSVGIIAKHGQTFSVIEHEMREEAMQRLPTIPRREVVGYAVPHSFEGLLANKSQLRAIGLLSVMSL